jgi:hypothetical protein
MDASKVHEKLHSFVSASNGDVSMACRMLRESIKEHEESIEELEAVLETLEYLEEKFEGGK